MISNLIQSTTNFALHMFFVMSVEVWMWFYSMGPCNAHFRTLVPASISGSNCIPQYFLRCNYLSLPEVPASGVLIYVSSLLHIVESWVTPNSCWIFMQPPDYPKKIIIDQGVWVLISLADFGFISFYLYRCYPFRNIGWVRVSASQITKYQHDGHTMMFWGRITDRDELNHHCG